MSRPRLGFVGLGWIGGVRMDAAAAAGAEVAALCESAPERLAQSGEKHPMAARFDAYEDLLEYAPELRLDGVVVATPNALHAPQSIGALAAGLAVFCQKPLARHTAEARAIVEAARHADRLLAVDYSYRCCDGTRALKRLVQAGELGEVHSIESVFHNAYGPDKSWCWDPAVAGGGALMDLGVHMIDLPLWMLGYPAVRAVHGRALREGRPLDGIGIDDFATARVEIDGGPAIHTAVSWNAHAGADCVMSVELFGTAGGAVFRNVEGSFFDFVAVRHTGRGAAPLTEESGEWMGRAIAEWVERLARSRAYDPEVERSITVAAVVDSVYGAGEGQGQAHGQGEGRGRGREPGRTESEIMVV